MADVHAKIRVNGKSQAREIDFKVVKQARRIGLPQCDIDALGLEWVGERHDAIMTDDGPALTPVYTAICMMNKIAHAMGVIAAENPVVGANALIEFGYTVDWQNGKLEKASGPHVGPLVRDSFETLAQHTGMRYEIDLVKWRLTLYPADEKTVTVVLPTPAVDPAQGELA